MAPRNPEIHSCLICDRFHPLRFCRQFLEMDIGARRRAVREHGYCFNCLARSHRTYECTSDDVCKICRQEHHSLLHLYPMMRISRDELERSRARQRVERAPVNDAHAHNRQRHRDEDPNRLEARRQFDEERRRARRLIVRAPMGRNNVEGLRSSVPRYMIQLAIRTLKRVTEALDT
ncbi:uncharacterized protein LOC131996371 [Stomoxys calcitrans]|uniref:uncharacterized protein LOC131996371 n=1 Tax=Stomoxys calcitrans TaxID=35570 RepID=UPI0027E321F8|nr:uncharacterized protein LOC131996371 [Stomoxys calcitrans]